MNAIALTFQNTQFDIVDRNGQPWLRVGQIAQALGYKDHRDCTRIYSRNADEFTDSMTALVELETEGGKQKIRVFSLRGCHLLGMFARTAVAKEFRKWVLDILENHTNLKYGLVQLPEPPTINKAQIGVLFNRVTKISAGSGKIRAELWSRFQNHFSLASYKDLPAQYYDQAMAYLNDKEAEYLGGPVNMLYISSTELEAKVQERVKAVEGELLEKAELLPRDTGIQPGIRVTHDQVLVTSGYKKEEFLRHLGYAGLTVIDGNDYLVIKKDEVLQKLQA